MSIEEKARALGEIDGAKTLDDVRVFVDRFCAFPDEHCLDAVTLWAAHAHMVEHFDTSPRLAALSAEPASGKTRVLEVLETLTPNPMFVFGASVAALFRSMANEQITLLFDECDCVFSKHGKDDQNEDLRALLNVGYKNGATIPRCVGNSHEVQRFSVFAPVALAGLGRLPDTLLSRSIVIRMRRRAPNETVEPFRPRQHGHEASLLHDRLAAWGAAVGPRAGAAWPTLPPGIVDRLAEVWEPIISIADIAGGHWPDRARKAAIVFAEAASDRPASLGIKLLTDIKAAFEARSAVFTSDLLSNLNEMETSPWGDLRGSPLNSRRLASLLHPYDIAPKDVRIGGTVRKGYTAEDFHDAWTRYVDPETLKAEVAEGQEVWTW